MMTRAIGGLRYLDRTHVRLPFPGGRVDVAYCLRGVPVLELLQLGSVCLVEKASVAYLERHGPRRKCWVPRNYIIMSNL
jgi:hypothetical protein